MGCTDQLNAGATVVANEFIDKYMAGANGDYVKVYLYLIRNCEKSLNVESIAENLQLTEGDVKRAIAYWEQQGIVSLRQTDEDESDEESRKAASAGSRRTAESGNSSIKALPKEEDPRAAYEAEAAKEKELRNHYRRADGKEALDRLSRDSEFEELLLIVQNYRSKILTEPEQQVLAYLYDGLHLPCEVLDYLVCYSVEKGHNNMRYIETTGLDWARLGIRTLEAAKARTREFDKLREKKTERQQKTSDRQGISRNTDYDAILLEQLAQRKLN